MRQAAWLSVLCLAVTAANAQDGSGNRKRPGEKVRQWANYNKPGTVQWVENYDEAVAKAVAERKLLMIVNFVGEMKDEGC